VNPHSTTIFETTTDTETNATTAQEEISIRRTHHFQVTTTHHVLHIHFQVTTTHSQNASCSTAFLLAHTSPENRPRARNIYAPPINVGSARDEKPALSEHTKLWQIASASAIASHNPPKREALRHTRDHLAFAGLILASAEADTLQITCATSVVAGEERVLQQEAESCKARTAHGGIGDLIESVAQHTAHNRGDQVRKAVDPCTNTNIRTNRKLRADDSLLARLFNHDLSLNNLGFDLGSGVTKMKLFQFTKEGI
jgi:hypothetical protein